MKGTIDVEVDYMITNQNFDSTDLWGGLSEEIAVKKK